MQVFLFSFHLVFALCVCAWRRVDRGKRFVIFFYSRCDMLDDHHLTLSSVVFKVWAKRREIEIWDALSCYDSNKMWWLTIEEYGFANVLLHYMHFFANKAFTFMQCAEKCQKDGKWFDCYYASRAVGDLL